MKLSECIDFYISYIADKSPHTVKNYKSDLKHFIQAIGDKDIENITKADIAKFRMYLQMNKKKSSTIARKLASLNSFFQYFIDIEIINASPITKSHRPKVSQKIPASLSDEEIKKILDNIQSLQDKVIISMMLTTGIRSSELLNIKRKNIILYRENQTYSIDYAINNGLKENDVAFIKIKGKGDKERDIPISGKTLEILIEYLKEIPFEDIFPISYYSLWRRIKNIGKSLGIELHPHKLRHTAATMALKSGTELRIIQELLGHASPTTTARYAKVGQKALIEATKILSNLLEK
ncbi:site-specific tyrosine recombinase XerD [Venenivibrio stagnispumantis]|uniref:Integrase/recombinase XerD n=1 Tax=Venenivibrio stagnispumantis TaxID=407998 RepID=A0AA46AEE9_9AQUI|nr:tyrosine-type recombinase/integrase [Venenivibrio stagnispumantis]MCW4573400.1 tyrosine-type recombinase/integrase [Venenivibrio stagnispumantis]SMP12321.1 integrase/recombinase XerD [Venenivibrio stagnispumantis]